MVGLFAILIKKDEKEQIKKIKDKIRALQATVDTTKRLKITSKDLEF